MIVFDFEYRNKYIIEDLVFVAFYNTSTKETSCFRTPEMGMVRDYVKCNKDETFACFVANADLPCLITCEVDIREIVFVDIFLLYLQLSKTHHDFLTESPSLVNALSAFDIDAGYSEHEKVDTVELILSNISYTPEQWKTIESYGRKDVLCLPLLVAKLLSAISDSSGLGMEWLLDVGKYHGEHLVRVAWADYFNDGFPVNTGRLEDIYENMEKIKSGLANRCNDEYCGTTYKPIYVSKKYGGYSFNMEGFTDFINRSGLSGQWKKTETGKLATDGDTFLDNVKGAPYLMLLYRTRKTFQQLSSKTDLRKLCKNGYIKAPQTGFWMASPYKTVTYRNTQSPKLGFVLNMTPWLRCALLEPRQGMAMVSCDWSAQEIAIAASLSGDENMRDLYNKKREGGDIYIFMGQMAGSIPADGTAKSHPAIRAMYKIVQLGLGYGMGETTLSEGIHNAGLDANGNPSITIGAALRKASEITAWHRKHFRVFWKWVETYIQKTRRSKHQITMDGLVCFLSRKTWKQTQIQNYPVQSTAGVMMRVAFNKLVDAGLDVVCSHHDAFYLNCKTEDAERVAKELERCMNEASEEVIGDFCPVICKAKIQYHGEWYEDSRGDEQLKVIGNLLGWDNNNNNLEKNDGQENMYRALIECDT